MSQAQTQTREWTYYGDCGTSSTLVIRVNRRLTTSGTDGTVKEKIRNWSLPITSTQRKYTVFEFSRFSVMVVRFVVSCKTFLDPGGTFYGHLETKNYPQFSSMISK